MTKLPLARWLILAAFIAGPALADERADVQALATQGNLPAALERADKWLLAKPNDVPMRFLRGLILMDLKRDDAALAAFNELSADHPDLPEPFNNIALLQARAGRLELARTALETALRNDPAHVLARRNLGEVYLRMAVQAWERAALQTPADTQLQQRLRAARDILNTAGR